MWFLKLLLFSLPQIYVTLQHSFGFQFLTPRFSTFQKKGANIKPIPPYRPATAEPKEEAGLTNQNTSDSWSSGKQAPKRKKSTSNTPDSKGNMESNENAMNLLSLSQASTSMPTPSDGTPDSGADNGELNWIENFN